MTTVATVVHRARRMLRGSKRETFNVLDEDLLAGATAVKCRLPIAKIVPGDFICLGTEIAFVTEVDAGTATLTVLRGIDGTEDANTIPAGTIIEVGWRFPTADLFGWAGDEIRSWPVGVYVVEPVSVTIGVSARSVDLPLTRFSFPLRARYKLGTREWVDIPRRTWRIEQGLPTSQFASGNALIVPSGISGSVIVEYAQALDTTTIGMATVLGDVGVNDTLVDALLYGVAWRAVAPEEGGRADRTSQPEPRNADEVKAGDALRTASAYKALRDMRLSEEVRRLRQLYPPHFG